MHAPLSLPDWPDLPLDVLREISGRLHNAADYVHFHAVCKPWRQTAAGTGMTKRSFLPWLLAPEMTLSILLNLRCVFSRTSYRALPPFSIRQSQRNWVASADGTAVWYFADSPSPSLRDPLTGAVSRFLPPFPHEDSGWEGSPTGVVYGDGTVLLDTKFIHHDYEMTKFRAALLRPGDTAWTVVEKTFASSVSAYLYVAYHRGKILITVDGLTLTPEEEFGVGDLLAVPTPWMPDKLDDYLYMSYVLESRGEFLCVSVHVNPDVIGGKPGVADLVAALSVSVHALEDDEPAQGKRRWVTKDGGSLADRVFFLGWPNSFAVDASRLSGDAVIGGCAYFVYQMMNEPCYVFSYNFLDDKLKFVERLPQGQKTDMYMWLVPQPSISPIQEIFDRIDGRKWWKKKKPHMAPSAMSNIYIQRPQPQYHNPYFRILVRNLPPNVDSDQLRQFFSKHGKVSNAEVICKKTNQMSDKMGRVTIMTKDEQDDALAALNGLGFNGYVLEVKLVHRRKGQNVSSTGSNPHNRDQLSYIGLFLLFLISYFIK
ncbi:unnamed protein product [Alopecurus aequalis]